MKVLVCDTGRQTGWCAYVEGHKDQTWVGGYLKDSDAVNDALLKYCQKVIGTEIQKCDEKEF